MTIHDHLKFYENKIQTGQHMSEREIKEYEAYRYYENSQRLVN